MHFEVDRDDLHHPGVGDAALGDTLRYRDFFPASTTGAASDNWSRVAVWGFADRLLAGMTTGGTHCDHETTTSTPQVGPNLGAACSIAHP